MVCRHFTRGSCRNVISIQWIDAAAVLVCSLGAAAQGDAYQRCFQPQVVGALCCEKPPKTRICWMLQVWSNEHCLTWVGTMLLNRGG